MLRLKRSLGGGLRQMCGEAWARTRCYTWQKANEVQTFSGFASAGEAEGGCEVDKVWQKYDVRGTADSTANEQNSTSRKRSAYVTQRRRLLSMMWRWHWQ